ncbi:MAG: hypothetical protein KAT05_16465 [Spirochaetes bacterium]|nr:hypothetical protein [Spirochaetota bacterium]
MVLMDSPFVEILPLKSLLIFSAISVISIMAGLTILNSKNNNNSSQEHKNTSNTFNHFYSQKLAKYFLNISGFFSLATVGIFTSVILYCIGGEFVESIAYFIKAVVIFIYVIGYLGLVWLLLFSRIKMQRDSKDFEKIKITYLDSAPPYHIMVHK